MDALKRSLAESPRSAEKSEQKSLPAKASKAAAKKKADPRQRHLLLPVSGSKEKEHARPARRKSAGKARKGA